VVVSDVTQGRPLFSIPGTAHRQISFHPSGNWLVIPGNTLQLIAVHEDPPVRELYIGGKSAVTGMEFALAQAMTQPNSQEMEAKGREAIDKALASFRKISERSPKKEFFEQILERVREQIETQMKEGREKAAAIRAGQAHAFPVRANEPVLAAGFSRDGRWLWCSTIAGFRVFEWESMPRVSEETIPSPVWKFEMTPTVAAGLNPQILAAVEERDGAGLLFASGKRLYRLDLSTGTTQSLIEFPGETCVTQLAISRDGQQLGVASVALDPQIARRRRGRAVKSWEIWSLPAIRAAVAQNQR
jgi:hypothetical protein